MSNNWQKSFIHNKENFILLKANCKTYKGALLGIAILTFFATLSISLSLSLWVNSNEYLKSELERTEFGDLTAWVSNFKRPNEEERLIEQIDSIPEITKFNLQKIIFTEYSANNIESDSEGQLILYEGKENCRYKFFSDDLKTYTLAPTKINDGELYVSPSMQQILKIKIGSKITFPITRNGGNKVFTIKGYYEDPFMGSSMIGMKGFLINQNDYNEICLMIKNSGINGLAREGKMVHIFAAENITEAELNKILSQKSLLFSYSEFSYSKKAIFDFMSVLQNAFSGLLLAFSLVLLFVVLIVIAYTINSSIESDFVNLGILKTIGFTNQKLCKIQLEQYLITIIFGMLIGIITSFPLTSVMSSLTITTSGILTPSGLPILLSILVFGGILIALALFIKLKVGKIKKISPISAICQSARESSIKQKNETCTKICYSKNSKFILNFSLAIRQITSSKKSYVGIFVVSVLLCFFASMIARMDSWLGRDGKGMMDAFNPADHDIGLQTFGDLKAEEAEKELLKFTGFSQKYALAMPNVEVNGISYGANVLDEPERYHILKGKTCRGENEIVLTEFVASELGVSIGDSVQVFGGLSNASFTVSGIYSCANDMGKNVGLNKTGFLKIARDNPNLWCHHYFLDNPNLKPAIKSHLEELYGGDIHVHENTWPGLFGIINAMRALVTIMYILTAIFILIVTFLNTTKLLRTEQKDLGIYKAIGFSDKDLRLSFCARFFIVSVLGSTVGLFLSSIFTNPLVNQIMRTAGISTFSSHATIANSLLPLCVVTILFTTFAMLSSYKIKMVSIKQLVSE